MFTTPMAWSFLVLAMLAMGWLTLRERVTRPDSRLAFHVSLYQRDQRKARFHYLSVWIGLLAAFASLACLGILAQSILDPSPLRRAILGVAYGVGLWGILITALVWTQVGKRVSEANSDGQSLTPFEARDTKRDKK